MKKRCCALVLALVLAAAAPLSAVAQAMADEEDVPQTTDARRNHVPGAWASFAAAASNVVYFPLRFAITIVTAEAGGLTGWLTGGDEAAAEAVWHGTDGQAYIRPEVIEGRERLRFGDYE